MAAKSGQLADSGQQIPASPLPRMQTSLNGDRSSAHNQLPPSPILPVTSRMRSDKSTPPSPLSKLDSRLDRRASTPLQTRRSVSNLHTAASSPPRPLSRRTSSSLLSTTSTRMSHSRTSSSSTIRDERKAPTAASVAQEYFRRDLTAHEGESTSPTVVILRDACFGHRYSRPRTSKALLGTIVERPERLHACILGASAAYVRLGGRHAGGRNPPHPDIRTAEPPFKIRRLATSIPLNSPAVTQVHGSKWMEELQIMCDSAEAKLAMNGKELARPIGHGKDEDGDPLPKLHEGDLYLCAESLDALQGCLGGVCEAVDMVLGPENTKRAFVCIRPPGHHCSSNYPSGFCWLNNVHVGIAHAAMTQGLTHAAIIDFDLHHGDGSQSIAWDHNRKAAGSHPKNANPYTKTPIGYFSLHDINSYPCEWGDEEKIKNASLCVENAHGQSVWNIHLGEWRDRADFWDLYETRYRVLLDKTRIFLRHHTARLQSSPSEPRPKAAIFLSAGFDASEWEGSGMQRHKVNVPTDFYARFTADVVQLAEEAGLGVDGRIISVLEGGYSDRALTSGVLSHLCGLTSHVGPSSNDHGLASAMANMGMLDKIQAFDPSTAKIPETTKSLAYESDWWGPAELEALEFAKNPTMEVKNVPKAASNYSSPTHASTAKMIEVARARRSLSAQQEARLAMEAEPAPPLPDVYWPEAAYELSRLLIPADRQTLSCRHDELNAEATKVRRDRQSSIGLPAAPVLEPRMQLRDRKAKAPSVQPLRADRRRTIAVESLPATTLGGDGAVDTQVHRTRRRSSAGSSILSAFESMKLTDGGSEASFSTTSVQDARVPARSNSKSKSTRAVLAKKAKPPSRNPVKKASPRKPAQAPIVHQASSETSGDREIGERHSSRESAMSAKSSLGDSADSASGKPRINLKVPSPEENAMRERARAAATKEASEKAKKARVMRKPAVPKAPKGAGGKKTPTTVPGGRQATVDDDTAGEWVVATQPANGASAPPHDFISTMIEEAAAAPTSSLPNNPAMPIAHVEAPTASAIAAPAPAPPQNPLAPSQAIPVPSAAIQPQPAQPHPPTQAPSATPFQPSHLRHPNPPFTLTRPVFSPLTPPSGPGGRNALPRFTSDSPIPFAKSAAPVAAGMPGPGPGLDGQSSAPWAHPGLQMDPNAQIRYGGVAPQPQEQQQEILPANPRLPHPPGAAHSPPHAPRAATANTSHEIADVNGQIVGGQQKPRSDEEGLWDVPPTPAGRP